jgi:calcium-binding protein CML
MERNGNKIDKLMLNAIRKAKRNGARPGKFNELLLKLPTIKEGFRKVKEVFDELDDNKDGTVDAEEFQRNCQLLGLEQNDPMLMDIYRSADLDGSSKIDIHEFISIVTVVYLLKAEEAKEKIHTSIRATLALIEGFFCHFDSSADGYIERVEIIRALGGKSTESSSAMAGKRLFDSLDWDNSGRISFKEFVVGMKRFALEDEDEVDESKEEEKDMTVQINH